MNYTKLAVAALLISALGGCFHTQLKGSVANSTLTITALDAPGTIISQAKSWTPEELKQRWGDKKWQRESSFTKLVFTGITQPSIDDIAPNELYLVTASGGKDYDPELNGELSDAPEQVQGNWHAIVSGQRIIEGNIKVSALTEALYLQLESQLSRLSNSAILERLDIASTLVVGDVDESGNIDYDDVLRWNRTLDEKMYLGDVAVIDELSDAIIAGQPQDMLEEKAKAVLGSHTVTLEFNMGTVVVETYDWDSPITVANFLQYVRSGFYDETLVHRVRRNFMIQMGWLDYLGTESGNVLWEMKTPNDPIINESYNGLSNLRGTLSMARTPDPDSANSQFFINHVDNDFLDYGSSSSPDGYAVFAQVISGIDVVDDIATVRALNAGSLSDGFPVTAVVLESATVSQ